jgi:hypothetical protein
MILEKVKPFFEAQHLRHTECTQVEKLMSRGMGFLAAMRAVAYDWEDSEESSPFFDGEFSTELESFYTTLGWLEGGEISLEKPTRL